MDRCGHRRAAMSVSYRWQSPRRAACAAGMHARASRELLQGWAPPPAALAEGWGREGAGPRPTFLPPGAAPAHTHEPRHADDGLRQVELNCCAMARRAPMQHSGDVLPPRPSGGAAIPVPNIGDDSWHTRINRRGQSDGAGATLGGVNPTENTPHPFRTHEACGAAAHQLASRWPRSARPSRGGRWYGPRARWISAATHFGAARHRQPRARPLVSVWRGAPKPRAGCGHAQ